MRAPIVKQGLMRLKYGSKAIESVESKLNQLKPGATKSEINQVINAMTNEEKSVITGLQKPEMKKVIQSATQDTIKGLKSGSKMATTSSLPEHIVNLFVYTAPVGKNLLDNISELKQKYLKAVKRQPTETEIKVLALVKKKLEEDNQLKIFDDVLKDPTKLKNVIESEEMKNSVNIALGFKGKSEEQIKKQVSNFVKNTESIIERMKNELETTNKPSINKPSINKPSINNNDNITGDKNDPLGIDI
jgi:hypothetical protein